jgi:hypothetical protein
MRTGTTPDAMRQNAVQPIDVLSGFAHHEHRHSDAQSAELSARLAKTLKNSNMLKLRNNLMAISSERSVPNSSAHRELPPSCKRTPSSRNPHAKQLAAAPS